MVLEFDTQSNCCYILHLYGWRENDEERGVQCITETFSVLFLVFDLETFGENNK